MCLGGGAPSYEPPPPDPELEAQKEAAKTANQQQLSAAKKKALSLEVSRLGGTFGARSLIGGGAASPRGFGSSLLS